MQWVLFHFRVRTVLRFWVSIKNLGQYKKLPSKKEHFAKHFVVCAFFLELQCLVDYFRIINVYQFFCTLNISFDKVDCREVEAQKYFVWYHLYPHFLKNCYGWPKLMTCIYTFREQVLYRKKWLQKCDSREKPKKVYYKIHTWS